MIFGSSSPFGASSPSLFGGASASSSPFGSTTSASPFGMNTAASNPFAAKPFGSPTFGQQQTGGLFGSGTATGVFGASQAAPFGSSSPAFGSSTAPPFGNTQAAFGASGSSVFGQKPASPFGSFGSTSSPANPFGTPTFGQTQASFGSQPFGSTTPAFGASSTPAFGSASAFSSQPATSFSNPFGATSSGFGSSTPFGQSTAAFGTGSAPAFGSTTPAFGTGAFTSSSSAFGSTLSFGSASKPGSRAYPYILKTEPDGSATCKLYSISAVDGYTNKSHEELRWEDYQAGDKGGPAPNSTGVFGSSPSNSPFGTPSITPGANPFSSSGAFGQQQKPQTTFPSFPTPSTPAFGTAPSIFNSASTPAISTTSSFGSFTTSSSLFNTTPSFSISPSTTPAFGTSSFGVQQPSVFQSPQTQPAFGQTSAPIFTSSSSSLFNNMNQSKPAGVSSSFFPSVPNSGSFSFVAQSQPGAFSTPGMPLFPAPTTSTPVPSMPTPISAPFGTLPAMPQMSIGRAAGSNPTVQYGISSIPVSDKPVQMQSNSLLTPRHVTPRSKIRMHARKLNAKKDAPKISFFSAGDEAPVTPKADVSLIPRENPRALFIHQVNQAPITAVAAKRAPDIVNLENNENLYSEPTFPVATDDSLPQDSSGLEWSSPHIDGVQTTTSKKVSSKSPSKQNGIREELNHRGNGYISMAGHRAGEAAIAYEHGADIEALMPKLKHTDYYTEPRVQELAAKERADPGYCRRVTDFIVGRKGYGHIKFLGETDVRRLDIEGIVQFNKCEVLVYMDESKKPPLGQGLNKPAEVTLLNVMCIDKASGRSFTEGPQVERFEKKLKKKTQAQGAEFVSFDPLKGEWTFRVKHFSRYGFDDSDGSDGSDDDALDAGKLIPTGMDMMEGVEDEAVYQENGADLILTSSGPSSVDGEVEEELLEDVRSRNYRRALPHSLPAQLKMDPLKLHQLKTSFFPLDEDDSTDMTGLASKKLTQPSMKQHKSVFVEEADPKRPSKQIKLSPHSVWQRSPMLLPPQVSSQTSPMPSLTKITRKSSAGFRLQKGDGDELLCMRKSGGVVDAALFMGTSFRVGWGPNGLLVHSGFVGQSKAVFSSTINVERVALDRTARDDRGEVKDSLLAFQFDAPLALHSSLSKVVRERNGLKLRSLLCSKGHLEKLANDYEDLIEKQHGAPGVSIADQLVLKHQVMVWQLISVLFSEKDDHHDSDTEEAPESMAEMKALIANIDPGTERLVRKASFSRWLQDSVFHLVQADLDSREDTSYLKDVLVYLTGKQVEPAVKKAILAGDVRLACLLSQTTGSVSNREDILSQLEVWEAEGLTDGLIESDRLSLFRLLGGDIHGSLGNGEMDWKRFVGMLMWYTLPPEAALSDVVLEFQRLVEAGDAFKPTPMYLEEAPAGTDVSSPPEAYDSAYYLMLLHANGSLDDDDVHKLLSTSASTFDRLDHRAAWHQKEVLQAIGVLRQTKTYALDMSFVSQLLAAGLVHWAVYVVLHMPDDADASDWHEKVIKEILSRYCQVWSNSETQRKFMEEDLGIPVEWLHETLAMYWLYRADFEKSLIHYLKSSLWQEAHVVFMTKVSASLLLNGKKEEIWNYTSQMDGHKMVIENWELGAGLYMDFFILLESFESTEAYDNPELESPVEAKMCACKDFFERIKESQRLWEARASKLLRIAFARMADEVAALLVASEKRAKRGDAALEMEVHSVAMEAGSIEDVQLCRLQGAVASFSNWIVQIAA